MIETTAIVCGHVFNEERPVRVAIHHLDGVWQLVCGEHDHPADCADFQVVGLQHIFERQANLGEISGLERSHVAENMDGVWQISPYDEDRA